MEKLQNYYKAQKTLKKVLTSDIIKNRVLAEDPVDARNVAVQRLIEETGDGLNANEITEVKKISDD